MKSVVLWVSEDFARRMRRHRYRLRGLSVSEAEAAEIRKAMRQEFEETMLFLDRCIAPEPLPSLQEVLASVEKFKEDIDGLKDA